MTTSIQSLATGVGVFKALHALGRPAGLREIAGLVRMHPSKLHRYLATLVKTGLVEQDVDRRYASGPDADQLLQRPTADHRPGSRRGEDPGGLP